MQKRRGGLIKIYAHFSNELTRTTLVHKQGQDKPKSKTFNLKFIELDHYLKSAEVIVISGVSKIKS